MLLAISHHHRQVGRVAEVDDYIHIVKICQAFPLERIHHTRQSKAILFFYHLRQHVPHCAAA